MSGVFNDNFLKHFFRQSMSNKKIHPYLPLIYIYPSHMICIYQMRNGQQWSILNAEKQKLLLTISTITIICHM